MTTVITVANLKGGSAKTTTTAYLAHAYAARGRAVLIVDADEQRSVTRWGEQAGWTIPVMGMATNKIHRQLADIIGEQFDVVLIDTPPLDEKSGPVYSAFRAADRILVPMAPTMMEFERLPDVWGAVEEIQDLRIVQARTAVLLNRTVANANSTTIIRNLIVDAGWDVLETTIPRREDIAQSFGAPVTNLHGYDLVAEELDKW